GQDAVDASGHDAVDASGPPAGAGELGPAAGAADPGHDAVDASGQDAVGASGSDETVPGVPPPPGYLSGPGREPRRWGLRRVLLAVGLLVGAAAIGVGIFVFVLLRGTGDVLASMLPADTTGYATVYLDPAAGQKRALLSLARRFQDVVPTEQVDLENPAAALDEVLADVGLTSDDVLRAVGTQIAVAGWYRGEQADPDLAMLIAVRDEAAARSVLDQLRRVTEDEGLSWRDTEYGEITVSTSTGGFTEPAYAIVDGAIVIATRAQVVEDVIDTSQGRGDALASAQRFTRTTEALPNDVLGLAYVSAAPLADLVAQSPDLGLLPQGFDLGALEAVTGAGFSVRAAPNGIGVDLTIGMDPARLTEQERSMLAVGQAPSEILALTPSDAYGVLAVSVGPQVGAALEELGTLSGFGLEDLDGPFDLGLADAVRQLRGDIGFEVGPGSAFPDGALLIGTQDEAAMQRLLDGAAQILSGDIGGTGLQSEVYAGASITSFRIPDPTLAGVAPAYAIADGVAIIASSPAEVRQILDAGGGQGSLVASEPYRQAVSQADADGQAVLYLDVGGIVDAVEGALPPGERLPDEARGYTEQLASAVLTISATEQAYRFRVFVGLVE
ncbi:MAG: DUF3352 domain-containing protein, partial [Egibacteraceae bacterium]